MENLNKRKTGTSKTMYYWKDSLCNVIDSVFMIKLWLWQTIWTSCSSFKTRFTKLKRVFLVGLCNYFGLSSLNDWETNEYQPQKRTQSFIKYQRWTFLKKMANGLDPFPTFAKNSISDLRQGSEYATEPCFSWSHSWNVIS